MSIFKVGHRYRYRVRHGHRGIVYECLDVGHNYAILESSDGLLFTIWGDHYHGLVKV